MDQPTSQEGNEPRAEQAAGFSYCAFHPGVETGLTCNQCGRHICTRCMVQVPVGIRCRECTGAQKLPTFDVRPSYYMKASVVGAAVAVVSGLVWGGVTAGFPFSPMAGFLALAVGYAVGESVSLATNRKRGTGLVVVVGANILLALLTASVVYTGIFRLLFANFFSLLMVFIAVFAGVNRVR